MQHELRKRDIVFTCPECGHLDYGKYCSYCGNALSFASSQVPLMLARLLAAKGFDLLFGELPLANGSQANVATFLPPDAIDSIRRSSVRVFGTHAIAMGVDRPNFRQCDIVLIASPLVAPTFDELKAFAPTLRQLFFDIASELRKSKIRRVIMSICVTYYGAIDPAFLNLVRDAAFQNRFSLKFSLLIRPIALSLEQSTYRPKSLAWQDPELTPGIRAVLDQVNVDRTLAQNGVDSGFWSALKYIAVDKPLEESKKLFELFLSVLFNPMRFAREIDREALSFRTALSYLLVLVVVDSAVDKAIGINELSLISELSPVGGEILVFLFFLGGNAMGALLIYAALKLLGGKGSFRKTFLLQIVLTLVFAPVVSAIDIAWFLWDQDAYRAKTTSLGANAQYGLIAMYCVPTLSVIHKLKPSRVGWALFLILLFSVFAGLFAATMLA